SGGAGDGRVPDGYQIPEKSGCGVWATLGSEKRYAAASPAPHVKARDGRPIGIRLTPFVLIQVRGERVIRLAAPGPPSGSRPDRGLRRGRAAPRCTRPFSSGSRFEANGDARPG